MSHRDQQDKGAASAAPITPRRFKLGDLVGTPGIQQCIMPEEVALVLYRHATGDWGELDAEDWARNNEAVAYEGDADRQSRIVSAYTIRGHKVYVITEWDRSRTTVMLDCEY